MKQCTHCKEFLPNGNFLKRSDCDKLRSHCKRCCNKINLLSYHKCDKINRAKASYRYSLKVNYNISEDEYNRLFTDQEGKCKICKIPLENRFLEIEGFKSSLDHCHTSNKVRGILCHLCNKALGSFKDNVNVVKEAVKYLENSI